MSLEGVVHKRFPQSFNSVKCYGILVIMDDVINHQQLSSYFTSNHFCEWNLYIKKIEEIIKDIIDR